MIAVVVYAILVVLGYMVILNHFSKHGIHSEYPSYQSLGGLIVGTVLISAPFYWWIIASVGWVPATMALVAWGVVSFLWAAGELLIIGRARVVFLDAVISFIAQSAIVIALFAAVP